MNNKNKQVRCTTQKNSAWKGHFCARGHLERNLYSQWSWSGNLPWCSPGRYTPSPPDTASHSPHQSFCIPSSSVAFYCWYTQTQPGEGQRSKDEKNHTGWHTQSNPCTPSHRWGARCLLQTCHGGLKDSNEVMRSIIVIVVALHLRTSIESELTG